MRVVFAAAAVLTLTLMGCGAKPAAPPAPVAPPTNANVTPPVNKASPAADLFSAVQEAQKSVESKAPGGVAPIPVPTTAVPPPGGTDNERVVAKQGVGIKGRSLDPHEGMVVTPVKTLFAAKEMAVFNIQVPSALQLYKATDTRGEGPKNHAEFMTGVIEANQIKLPQLPPGHKYIYDPATEQLMVERPKAAVAPNEPPK